MKKFFLGLVALVTLFSACSSDEVTVDSSAEKGAGTLKATLAFSSSSELKATPSGAIPKTDWGNINQMHVILYQKGGANDGKVAFSQELKHATIIAQAGDEKSFTWSSVPAGTYRLVIVANTGASDPIQGKRGTADIVWDQNTIVNQKFGSTTTTDLYLDFKKITTTPTFPAPYNTKGIAAGNIAYSVPAEIFTVYDDNVTITEGVTTTIGSPTSLKLKREVALFRTRLNVTHPDAPFLADVEFNNVNNFMLVQTLPVGLGIKTDAYVGGVFVGSDNKKVLVAKTGANAFSATPPTTSSHSNPTQILTDGYTLWNEFAIFSNGAAGEATVGRKYNIVVSAFAKAGYVAEDGVVPAGGANIYWDGVINETFEPNVIREVDITIKTRGTLEPPVTPVPVGKLIINVGKPLDWDSNIKTTTTEI